MEAVWFTLIAIMLSVYVILDGFDFGAGIVHLLVAKTDEERRTVFAAIGPLWDGNEVWLLSGGGVIFYAFPRAYAAGFSGFYMALIIVLWLLILRGLSIEFRSKEQNSLWRSFWDGTFFFSSTLMAVVLGAALGNLIRGVPIGPDGYFSAPLFTTFTPGQNPGILDWYTVLVGVFALLVLAGHGALYLAWKTTGAVQERSRSLAGKIWLLVVAVGALTTFATEYLRPDLYANLIHRPWTWILAALILVGLGLLLSSLNRGRELPAFLGSALFIVAMLAATAAGMYPNILISTVSPQLTLTAHNAAAGSAALAVGLGWWIAAVILAIFYFGYLFYQFRGKVKPDAEGHGY